MKPLGTTFNPKLEYAAQDGSEWLFGAIETDLALIPVELRLRYCPEGVLQYNDVFDTNGCASRAPLNALEAKLNYFYDHGMHDDLKRWFDMHGYRVNGKFVLADAFIEILSGTTPQGNSLKAPIDAIRKHGVIPASYLPLEKGMTWSEYMNPDRITAEMIRLGKEFNKRIGVNYEKALVMDFISALKEDILVVGGHGWPPEKNGVYPRTEAPFNHAFALVTDAILAFDNYLPFSKLLAKDYKFFEWGYSLSITRQTPFPDETVALFEVLRENGLLAFFAEALKRLIDGPTPAPTPTIPPAPTPTNPTTNSEKLVGDERLIAALIQVESGGDDYAIGDKHLVHKAYGCLQIRKPFCDDVNRVYGTNRQPPDMLGNRELSIDTVRKYWTIYKCKTDEEKARVINGGPSAKTPGTKMYKATNGYWAKVKKLL